LQFIPGVTCRDSRHDALTGYRAAAVENKQLQWVLFAGTDLVEVDPLWLNQQFSASFSTDNHLQLLSGRADQSGAIDNSALICSCFSVRSKAICRAIANGADSTAKLGKLLQCGTNCGSCLPELNQLLRQQLSLTSEGA